MVELTSTITADMEPASKVITVFKEEWEKLTDEPVPDHVLNKLHGVCSALTLKTMGVSHG